MVSCKKNIIGSLLIMFFFAQAHAQTIDRKALVQRHNVIVTSVDSLSSLSIGNGKFAFTVDVTGLQSFPDAYAKGIPLGTESEWGWHSFPNKNNYKPEEALKTYHLNGRDVTYSVQWNEAGRNKDAANWFRQNPHRLQLGNIGFEIFLKNGSEATINDIKNIRQELDLYTGEIHSHFTVEDVPVDVITACHPVRDGISANVISPLVKEKRIQVRLRFSYPTGEWTDVGTNWDNDDKHVSTIVKPARNETPWIKRDLGEGQEYFVIVKGSVSRRRDSENYFVYTPYTTSDSFDFNCEFFNRSFKILPTDPSYSETITANRAAWKKFWESGGAVDFSGSTDPRANELERRIILSQYLFRIQEAGSNPSQETGLTYNSWFGKPHMEMHWWHAVHYALWGRIDHLEKSLAWYNKAFEKAKQLAKRQGYQGARWQKMTDNDGDESPSSVGAFLIWQQPHIIYFAELCYREHKNMATLNRYRHLVFATAEFMASYAFYDKEKRRYILGKGVIPAQERFKPEETFNPTYELAYWYWALKTAQQWRERLHLARNTKWDDVINKLSALPQKDGLYLAAESATNSYTDPQYKTDHPSVLATFGVLPYMSKTDTAIMHHTFDWVWNNWTWNDTWGWDFPMTAMTAARLNIPERAIDALMMNIRTNTYLPNGHNYQDDRLRLYMPGNGGLLTAIAMMCAGWEGCRKANPGIPVNGKWKVKWEGLRKMP